MNPDLEERIRSRIREITAGQIQSLGVEAAGNRVVVRGNATCYYHKQLAIRGVFDAIGDRSSIQVDVLIEVVEPRHPVVTGREIQV